MTALTVITSCVLMPVINWPVERSKWHLIRIHFLWTVKSKNYKDGNHAKLWGYTQYLYNVYSICTHVISSTQKENKTSDNASWHDVRREVAFQGSAPQRRLTHLLWKVIRQSRDCQWRIARYVSWRGIYLLCFPYSGIGLRSSFRAR